MKKIIVFLAFLLLLGNAAAQNKSSDKILDVNYTATYKNTLSFKWLSRISESQDWSIRSFTAGGAYNLNTGASRLSVTYDLWRGNEINSQIYKRYGLAYTTQGKSTNLSFSIFQTDVPNQIGSFQGRLDLNTKFN